MLLLENEKSNKKWPMARDPSYVSGMYRVFIPQEVETSYFKLLTSISIPSEVFRIWEIPIGLS
jgi:hypothetical protein